MKKLLFVLLFVPSFLCGQTWEKTFGGVEDDYGQSVVQTSDGGYIIAGSTASMGSGGYDVYLIKTDVYGNALWTNTYGGTNHDYGYSVQQTTDGGYIITGLTWSFGEGSCDVYLIKTDDQGNMMWFNTFGDVSYDGGYCVEQTADNGYIISGYSELDYDIRLYLIKTDSNGLAIWTKLFGGEDKEGFSVQQTTDGGYIVAGYTFWSFDSGNQTYLMKTDSNGDSLWTMVYEGTAGASEGRSVRQTTDGGYVITGFSQPSVNMSVDVSLIKTDEYGQEQWMQTFGGDAQDIGFSVWQTADNGYIIAGQTSSYGDGTHNVFLIKTDVNGDTLWQKAMGGTGTDIGFAVRQTTDEGYIIAGSTDSFNNMSQDVYLIKTDGNGNVLSVGEIPVDNAHRKLVGIVDMSGRTLHSQPENGMYIEVYDDGSTRKRMPVSVR